MSAPDIWGDTIMQNVSERVNGLQYVTTVPADDDLYEAVRNIKRYGNLGDLAEVSGLSERSLYRYASEDVEKRPAFTPDTRWALAGALEGVGLLAAYGLPDLKAAVVALARLADEKRATTAREAEAVARRGKEAEGRVPPGQTPRTEEPGNS